VKRRRAVARLQLLASGLCFGLMATLARLGSRGEEDFTAFQMATVRFAVGVALTVALFRMRPGTFRPVRHRLLFTRGALGGASALLYFIALARIPAGEATLLNNCFPVLAVLLSFFTLGERLTVHLAVALAVVSFGVFLVIGPGSTTFGVGVGELAGIASAVLSAGAVTSIRVLRQTDNAPTIFFAFSVGALVVSIPFAMAPWPRDGVAYLAAAGVGVVAFGAQLFMTEAYGALSVAEAALWQQLTPIASYLWALTIGETIGWKTIGGVLLGVAGIVYGSVLGHRPRHRASPEARIAEGIPAEEP
jgi:drug/metabolite transporter (DMT)-like permease